MKRLGAVSYTHLDVYKRQLQNKLKQNNTPNELINEITETLNIITKQNYFTHNNTFYTQNDGLPMGSPISSILAEVFLQHLEKTKIFTNNDRHSHKILYWHRYVDIIVKRRMAFQFAPFHIINGNITAIFITVLQVSLFPNPACLLYTSKGLLQH